MITDWVCTLLQLYLLVLFARIILSWFPLSPGGVMTSVHSLLFTITEPLLGPIRRLLPPVRMGSMALDLSPIVVLIGIQLLPIQICS